jgi:osmotically-inducible protein OsmY
MATMASIRKSDSQIKEDVLRELKWDPRVEETEVGVQVENAVVTLMGTVSGWAKRVAAQEAAHRVYGVRDVANDIVVKMLGSTPVTDTEIAQAVRRTLEWDVFVPDERITSTVSNGWVTLEGRVDVWSQHEAAEVIAAAVIIQTTGLRIADPIASGLIGLFIVPRTVGLIRQAVHVLMEGVPAHLDVREIERALAAVPGVQAVHDLHVWTLTSGKDAMSAHVVVTDAAPTDKVTRALHELVHERFGIDHATIQIEPESVRQPVQGETLSGGRRPDVPDRERDSLCPSPGR